MCAQLLGDLVDVETTFHGLLLELAEREVLAVDDEPDLALVCLAAHAAAELAQKLDVLVGLDGVLDDVAVDDHGLVKHEHATALVVTPDALGLGACGVQARTIQDTGGRWTERAGESVGD